jgi:4-amino-4-deoxy-L-arabinose transferase-like glycosyltransferase
VSESTSAAGESRPIWRFPSAVGWRDHVVGLLLATAYSAWLLATTRSLGFGRDEGFYFRAASNYWRWYDVLLTSPSKAFDRRLIDSVWSDNHEHPPLMKALFAFSWHFFHEKWHVFQDASDAFRLPGILMAGAILWITYLFGARAYSRRAGVIAAALFAFMPRVFFNAHLACFDVGIVTMWCWCLYVYWRTQVDGGWLRGLAAGIVFGLALATKHNAWILPAIIVPHAFFANWRRPLKGLKTGRLPVLVTMGIVGPLVWYALWPWMWNDLKPRLNEYVSFHANHVYYNMEFIHVNYYGPPSPRLYMPVMILATVPAITLMLFLAGGFSRARLHVDSLVAFAKRRRSNGGGASDGSYGERGAQTDLLFLLAIGGAVGPWLLPKTPIFGGTKHWLAAYPFMALFAGHAFDQVSRAMHRALSQTRVAAWQVRRWSGAADVALAGVVLAGPLAITAHSHPFGLSSYVPIVGGTAGGADFGLNRQFWGFTTESLEPYFEAKAPQGAVVYVNDTAWDSWQRLVDEKRVRPDLRAAGAPSDSDIAIVHIERHMMEVEYKIWWVFGTDIPDYVLTHDGVPIIDVFRRKR